MSSTNELEHPVLWTGVEAELRDGFVTKARELSDGLIVESETQVLPFM